MIWSTIFWENKTFFIETGSCRLLNSFDVYPSIEKSQALNYLAYGLTAMILSKVQHSRNNSIRKDEDLEKNVRRRIASEKALSKAIILWIVDQ